MVFKVDVPSSLISGDVDEGYGAVADVFRQNFAERNEVGAALSVFRDGVPVVDLWGGYRDGRTRLPWQRDTMVAVYSTSKGMSALPVAMANSRGLLDYDATVATYWPEFAAAGKENITLRQLLAHQAGLPVIDRKLSVTDLADLDTVAAAIAEQRPAWEPGTRHGYHGISIGWYEAELLRRVDPEHRTLGRFFADEIAGPLGLEFYIGLPDDVPDERIAHVHDYKPHEMLFHLREFPPRFVAGFLNPRSVTFRSFANPKILREIGNYNDRAVKRLEVPAANGVGEARGIAAAYAEMATGGAKLGITPATLAALSEPAREPSGGPMDVVLGVNTIFSLGMVKPFPWFRFGASGWKAFGTPGAGGSFAFADPETGIGFAYTPNRAGFRLWDDDREVALRDALYRTVLGEAPQRPDSRR